MPIMRDDDQEWVLAKSMLNDVLIASTDYDEAREYFALGFAYKYDIDIEIKEVIELLYEGNFMGLSSVLLNKPRRARKAGSFWTKSASAPVDGPSKKKFWRGDKGRQQRALEILRDIELGSGSRDELKDQLIVYGIAVIFMKKRELQEDWKESFRRGDETLRGFLIGCVMPEVEAHTDF